MASAVTYEMVEDVCNHLAAGGESPTYLKVHQRLGKGSTRIVSAYIRQWREAHALSKALERDPLFGEWPEALQLKARSLFDGLLALSAEAANASAESQRSSFEERERALAAKAHEAACLADDALDKLRSEQAESARLAVEVRSLEAAAEGRRRRTGQHGAAAGPWIVLTLALLPVRHLISVLDAWWLGEAATQYLVGAWNLVAIAVYARLLWQLLLWLRRDGD